MSIARLSKILPWWLVLWGLGSLVMGCESTGSVSTSVSVGVGYYHGPYYGPYYRRPGYWRPVGPPPRPRPPPRPLPDRPRPMPR